jgi:hypothetical protein
MGQNLRSKERINHILVAIPFAIFGWRISAWRDAKRIKILIKLKKILRD